MPGSSSRSNVADPRAGRCSRSDDDGGGEVALAALVGAVDACAAPPKPEWQRSADAHPNDLGRLVVPDVT